MRHFFILVFLALAGYFAWKFSQKDVRDTVRSFLAAHLPWVVCILVVAYIALGVQFYLHSTKIL